LIEGPGKTGPSLNLNQRLTNPIGHHAFSYRHRNYHFGCSTRDHCYELNQSGDGFQILTLVNIPDAFIAPGIFFPNASSPRQAANRHAPLPLSRNNLEKVWMNRHHTFAKSKFIWQRKNI